MIDWIFGLINTLIEIIFNALMTVLEFVCYFIFDVVLKGAVGIFFTAFEWIATNAMLLIIRILEIIWNLLSSIFGVIADVAQYIFQFHYITGLIIVVVVIFIIASKNK